jgi:hypothetical protein
MEDKLKNFIEKYIAIGDNPTYGGKHCGSDAEHEGAAFIAEKLKEIGMDSVDIFPVPCDKFQFNDATLTADELDIVIKPYACPSKGTGNDVVTGELCFLPLDANMKNVKEEDIKGKIVVIESLTGLEDGGIPDNMKAIGAEEKGALAVLLHVKEEYLLNEETIQVIAMNLVPNIPTLSISPKDFHILQDIAKKDPKKKFTLKADMEYLPKGGEAHEVVGKIEGLSDETIMYTAHLDHYFRCVQDNVSACATLIGIAEKFIKERNAGNLPKRNILFVFNGAHELGGSDTVNPDYHGFFGLMKRPEMQGLKIIADINFEYTAMRMHELRAGASYETADTYEQFVKTMPAEMPGMGPVKKDILLEGYMYFTWCDALIAVIHGIPVYMNDAVSEQEFDKTSPYIGRDHSNSDNMDIFDGEALASMNEWYFMLGKYIDNMPLVQLDFSCRAKQLLLPDDVSEIPKIVGIRKEKFNGKVKELIKAGDELYGMIRKYNNLHSGEPPRSAENKRLLSIMKNFGTYTDWLTGTAVAMLMVRHNVNLYRLSLFMELDEILEKGDDLKKAFSKLSEIDVASAAIESGPEMEEHFRDLLSGKNQTYGIGRTAEPVMMAKAVALLEAGNIKKLRSFLSKKIIKEAFALKKVLKYELAGIADIKGQIEDAIKEFGN